MTVRGDASAETLRRRFNDRGLHGIVVVDGEDRLIGVLARSDLERAGTNVAELATRRPATAVPDEPVFRAVQRMANLDVGRLPVVDPRNGRVVGVFRRADIVRAYDRGIQRSVTEKMARESSQLRDVTGLHAVQLVVGRGSSVESAAVRDVRWPERTILTGVRRGTEAIVPDGSTELAAGDLVVALTAHPEDLRVMIVEPAAAPADPSNGAQP